MTQFCTSDRPSTLPVAEHVAQFLVLHLGQRRIHHQDQADGDGDVGRADLEAVDERLHARDEVPSADADRHARKIQSVR